MSSTRDDSSTRAVVSPLAWAVLALCAAWCVMWFLHARGYWEDDAYIHLEFARSVAEGHGFSFNGRVVYGDTSPLWVLLLVGMHKVFSASWMAAGKALTVVAACFALTGVFFFSRSLVSREPARKSITPERASLFAALMVLFVVTTPYFGYWAFSGMEALTGAGLVCWGALAVTPQQLSPRRFLLGALAAGIAPILRPEMSFFTVLLGLVLLQRLYKMQVAAGWKPALLIAGLVLATTPAVLWARYAMHTFGMIVPNTNAAKRAGPAESVPARLVNIYSLGYPLVVVGALVLAAWVVWYLARGRREGAASLANLLPAGGWLLAVWTCLTCVFYVADHTYVQTRYIFVTAPVLSIVLLALAAQRMPRVFPALLGLALAYGTAMGFAATWPLVHNKIWNDATVAHLAEFVKTLPPDAQIADYSIGEIAFLSQRTIVDTGGITRTGAIPYILKPDEKPLLTWASHEGANYVVMNHAPFPGAVLVWQEETPTVGWYVNPKKFQETGMLQLWTLPKQP